MRNVKRGERDKGCNARCEVIEKDRENEMGNWVLGFEGGAEGSLVNIGYSKGIICI